LILNLEHEDLEDKSKFIFGSNGHRLVKKIVQSIKTSSESNQKHLESFIEKLIQLILKHLNDFLESKGIFIIIAILENTEYKESLLLILKKYSKLINGLAENAGAQVLKKLINE